MGWCGDRGIWVMDCLKGKMDGVWRFIKCQDNVKLNLAYKEVGWNNRSQGMRGALWISWTTTAG
jgi:hypothetical protein